MTDDLEQRMEARILAALKKASGPCFIILGPTGTGKTAAMRWLMLKFGGLIMHARELGSCERRHALGDGYSPEFKLLRREPVVYIDDLGEEDPRDTPVITEAIDIRYRHGLAVAVNSRRTRQELTQRYGASYVRRLAEQRPQAFNNARTALVDVFASRDDDFSDWEDT